MKPAILLLLCAQIAFSAEAPVLKQTASLIDALTAKNKFNNWPTIGALEKWSMSVDTFGTSSLPAPVRIKATFIECGSRTDEVDFDWIVPFRSTTAIINQESSIVNQSKARGR